MTDEKHRTEVVQRKPIPEEPEQLSLWRKIVEGRSEIAKLILNWEEFAEKQRAGWTPIDAFPEERRAEVAEHRAYGERVLTENVTVLRARLSEIDQIVEDGTRRDAQKDRNGITLGKLQKCAALAGFGPERDEELKGFIELYLRYKHVKDEGHAKLTRGTVDALMDRYYGLPPQDLDELARQARKHRSENDDFGTHKKLARWIVEAVKARAPA